MRKIRTNRTEAAPLANGRWDMAGDEAERRRWQTCGAAALQAIRKKGE
jgi:hypothetical protein